VKRRWDWRCLAVIAVVLGALVWVGVSIAMLLAELRPLLTGL
jgi:hypothetical protein